MQKTKKLQELFLYFRGRTGREENRQKKKEKKPNLNRNMKTLSAKLISNGSYKLPPEKVHNRSRGQF